MMRYDLSADTDSGVVLCRILHPLPDDDAATLINGVTDMIEAARSAWGPVRILFDDSLGHALAAPAMHALAARLRAVTAPGDRLALLVPGLLGKIAASGEAIVGTRLFLSEAGALDWLGRREGFSADAA